MSQAEGSVAATKGHDAPDGFTVDAEHGDPLDAAYNYADTVERGLIHMATKAGTNGGLDAGDLDAVLWSLSYTAAMTKAMILAAGQKGGAQ